MYCQDLEIKGSDPSEVELDVHSTSVEFVLEAKLCIARQLQNMKIVLSCMSSLIVAHTDSSINRLQWPSTITYACFTSDLLSYFVQC